MVSAHSLEHMAESMILGGFVWEVYFCVEIGSFVPGLVSDYIPAHDAHPTGFTGCGYAGNRCGQYFVCQRFLSGQAAV